MKISKFIIGTGLGLTPMIFVQAYFGEAFVKTHAVLYTILIWISIIYVLAFAYILLRILFKKREISKNISKEEKLILSSEEI
jgi:uncharacterized membrane protein YdjX (TVP38/TMEM64 family)